MPAALPALTGLLWIRQGLALFRQNPLEFLSLQLVCWTSLSMLQLLPLIGQLLSLILVPACGFIVMQACRQVARGESPWAESLINELRPQAQAMLRLGLVWVLTTVLASLTASAIFVLFDDRLSWKMLSGQIPLQAEKIQASHLWLASSGAVCAILPLLMALWFAPMLVVWQKMTAPKAMFFSLMTIWQARLPFLLYGLAWVFLFFLSVFLAALVSIPFTLILPPFILAFILTPALFLLLLTVFCCSIYCSYQSLLQNRESGQAYEKA